MSNWHFCRTYDDSTHSYTCKGHNKSHNIMCRMGEKRSQQTKRIKLTHSYMSVKKQYIRFRRCFIHNIWLCACAGAQMGLCFNDWLRGGTLGWKSFESHKEWEERTDPSLLLSRASYDFHSNVSVHFSVESTILSVNIFQYKKKINKFKRHSLLHIVMQSATLALNL